MHLFYADESYDQHKFVLTALCVEDISWRAAFDLTKAFRRTLKASRGIKMHAEIHAHSFIRDCSDGISTNKLSLADRRQIFEEIVRHIATLPAVLFNVCLDVQRFGGTERTHAIAVERLANRIQTMMRVTKSHAIVIFDEGKEREVTKIIRRLNVFNPIPSAYGWWDGSGEHRNIVLDRFIEDPLFKPSASSYFLQLVDVAAFTLLKQETPPAPFIARWGYDTLFPLLHPACFRPASRKDPHGIVR